MEKSGALINWHALTGCDTTGHIHGKGKKGCFAAFMKASPTILIALAGRGEGEEPFEEVLRGCEEFLCSLFCPRGVHIGEAKMLRWFKQLRDEQGVDKLKPTQGAWIEHIRRAHVQANIWHQDMVLNPTCLDPLTLGWRYLDRKLVPVLSHVAPAPVSLLQLVRCNYEKSKCSRRCSCRGENVVCTELCKCGGEGGNCTNITPPMIGEDPVQPVTLTLLIHACSIVLPLKHLSMFMLYNHHNNIILNLPPYSTLFLSNVFKSYIRFYSIGILVYAKRHLT